MTFASRRLKKYSGTPRADRAGHAGGVPDVEDDAESRTVAGPGRGSQAGGFAARR
jgi:hypothetical protein